MFQIDEWFYNKTDSAISEDYLRAHVVRFYQGEDVPLEFFKNEKPTTTTTTTTQSTTTTTEKLGNCSTDGLDVPAELSLLSSTLSINETTVSVGGSITLGCPESEQVSYDDIKMSTRKNYVYLRNITASKLIKKRSGRRYMKRPLNYIYITFVSI